MIENVIWVISFITLYLAFIWLNFLYLNFFSKKPIITKCPSLTLAVPAFNEGASIVGTLSSIVKADYPRDKRKIIVINDGSVDNTQSVTEEYINSNPDEDITLINKQNAGKAAALNSALDITETELFACVDADSHIHPDSIKLMLHHLDNEKTGAVITAIKVNNPKSIYEKVQRIEYILSTLMRKVRASINTLTMTPGVLSVYKTKVLKEVDGFDQDNITEDFEIAMRLKYHGYNIKLESDSYTYTNCPNTMKKLWRQRIRWFRGYLYNHIKYKDMFFNKKYSGLLSYFQLPLNILAIPLLLTTSSIILYNLAIRIYEVGLRMIIIPGYINRIFYFPTFESFILGQNLRITFPLFIAFCATMYMFYVAHKQVKEKISFPIPILLYFMILPYLSSVYWITAITQEIRKTKRKW